MNSYQAVVLVPHIINIEARTITDAEKLMANYFRRTKLQHTLRATGAQAHYDDVFLVIQSLEIIKDEKLPCYRYPSSLVWADITSNGAHKNTIQSRPDTPTK